MKNNREIVILSACEISARDLADMARNGWDAFFNVHENRIYLYKGFDDELEFIESWR